MIRKAAEKVRRLAKGTRLELNLIRLRQTPNVKTSEGNKGLQRLHHDKRVGFGRRLEDRRVTRDAALSKTQGIDGDSEETWR